MLLIIPLAFLLQSQVKSLIRFHVHTVRSVCMQGRMQRYKKSSFFTGFLPTAVKYMVDMDYSQMSDITGSHIVRKNAPTLFHGFHAFIISSSSAGVRVSIPTSLHSDTSPLISSLISLVS